MKTFIIIKLALILSCSVFAQWQQTASVPQGAGVTDMVVLDDGTLIVTTASYNWPNGQPGGIRRSTDGGNSWQNVLDIYNARTLWLGSAGKIFSSCWPYPNFEGAYYSTNNGSNWILMLTLSGNNNIFSIAAKNNDSTIFLGTRDGVRRSTNNGNSFINLTNGFPSNTFIYDLHIDNSGNYIAAGTSKGLYISSNNGNLWSAVAGVTQNDTIYSVKFVDYLSDSRVPETKLLAGSADGKLYQSGNELVAATVIFAFFGKIGDIEVVDDHILRMIGVGLTVRNFDNSISEGFAKSTDKGVSWIQENNGLPSVPNVSSIAYRVLGASIRFYAGLFGNLNDGAQIYMQNFPIGIQQISGGIPYRFSLSQNYPNPFNPVTNIEFAVPKPSFVRLVVYDMLGRETETLVSTNLKAGTYRADWNAAKYTSGVYFYRLISGSFTETKKMILVK